MDSFVYFGHDVFDAFTNMAIDEVLQKKSEEDGKTFVRFYEFEKPSIILAYVEDPLDVICSPDEFDITRRWSNGSAILCDENTLSYSISGPISLFQNVTKMHNIFGERIGKAIKDYLKTGEVSVGEHFRIRIDGGTVAGHGQFAGRSILYHGIIAILPWDMQKISRAIKLREREYEYIASLPSISQYKPSVDKRDIAKYMLAKITNGKYEEITAKERTEVLGQALVRSEFYKNPDWINFGPYHNDATQRHLLQGNSNLGFCFTGPVVP